MSCCHNLNLSISISDVKSGLYYYSFNPCFPFNEGDCKGVAVRFRFVFIYKFVLCNLIGRTNVIRISRDKAGYFPKQDVCFILLK